MESIWKELVVEMEKKSKVLIIIPAYNEAENIEKVADNLIENFPQYDYVIINDGSDDNTAEICIKNHYELLNLPINMGIGGAVQTGYRYARDMGYDIDDVSSIVQVPLTPVASNP